MYLWVCPREASHPLGIWAAHWPPHIRRQSSPCKRIGALMQICPFIYCQRTVAVWEFWSLRISYLVLYLLVLILFWYVVDVVVWMRRPLYVQGIWIFGLQLVEIWGELGSTHFKHPRHCSHTHFLPCATFRPLSTFRDPHPWTLYKMINFLWLLSVF